MWSKCNPIGASVATLVRAPDARVYTCKLEHDVECLAVCTPKGPCRYMVYT